MYLRFFKHLLSSAVTSTRYHKILLMSSKHWHFLSREIFNKLYKLRMRSDGMTGICRTLRFLLGSSIFYPTFAKTRLRLRQFARWRKLARTSFGKPRDRHFIPAFHPDSFFQSLAILTIIERNLFHSPRILPRTLKVWTKEKFQNCIWQMEELIFGFVTVENLRAS